MLLTGMDDRLDVLLMGLKAYQEEGAHSQGSSQVIQTLSPLGGSHHGLRWCCNQLRGMNASLTVWSEPGTHCWWRIAYPLPAN